MTVPQEFVSAKLTITKSLIHAIYVILFVEVVAVHLTQIV